MTYTLKIKSLGEIEVKEDQSLLSALKENNYFVQSSCGGCASCGECVIKVTAGDEYLSAIEFEESKLIGNSFHLTKERLSCQTKIFGTVEIDISDHDERTIEARRQAKAGRKILLKKGGREHNFEPREPKEPKEGGFRKPKIFKYDEE